MYAQKKAGPKSQGDPTTGLLIFLVSSKIVSLGSEDFMECVKKYPVHQWYNDLILLITYSLIRPDSVYFSFVIYNKII